MTDNVIRCDDEDERVATRLDDGRFRLELRPYPQATETAACCLCGRRETRSFRADRPNPRPFERPWICHMHDTMRYDVPAAIASGRAGSLAIWRLAAVVGALKEATHGR